MSFGRCRRSLGKHHNLPAVSASLNQQALTTPQDHHGALCSCVSPRLFTDDQSLQVHLRDAIRLHDQDRPADMAYLHGVSHYEAQVRHSARPLLPLPVRQRS